MKTHNLKCESKYFEKICSGEKTFEIRKNDRNFRVNDTLKLMEVKNGKFTKRTALCLVMYILNDARFVKKNHVAMSTKLIGCWSENV